MVTTMSFLIILTKLIETMYEFDVEDKTFNKVSGKK